MNYETDNHITGRTQNPWDPEKTPGGSSGGESAAIAARFSAAGLGSDGGGSVRIPAHFTGITALKPTPGRVSAAGHFPEICHPGGLLGVAGPMARTVKDLKLLFEILVGYDPEDPFSAPVPFREARWNELRIGLLETIADTPIAPAIQEAVSRAAKTFESLGFPVEPVKLDILDASPGLWWFFFGRLNAPLIRAAVGEGEEKAHWTGVELLHLAEREPMPTLEETLQNLARRDKMRASLLKKLEATTVLLLPPCAVPAFPHRQRKWTIGSRQMELLEVMRPVVPFNLFGLPALVLPFGFDESGMPVGIQLAAGPYQEEMLLALGSLLEEARGPFPAPSSFVN